MGVWSPRPVEERRPWEGLDGVRGPNGALHTPLPRRELSFAPTGSKRLLSVGAVYATSSTHAGTPHQRSLFRLLSFHLLPFRAGFNF